MSLNWVRLPRGEFTAQQVQTRAVYTMTPRAFLAALVQHNSANSSVGTNLRHRWEYRPGSELFVVYNDERDTRAPGFPELSNRTFIVTIARPCCGSDDELRGVGMSSAKPARSSEHSAVRDR